MHLKNFKKISLIISFVVMSIFVAGDLAMAAKWSGLVNLKNSSPVVRERAAVKPATAPDQAIARSAENVVRPVMYILPENTRCGEALKASKPSAVGEFFGLRAKSENDPASEWVPILKKKIQLADTEIKQLCAIKASLSGLATIGLGSEKFSIKDLFSNINVSSARIVWGAVFDKINNNYFGILVVANDDSQNPTFTVTTDALQNIDRALINGKPISSLANSEILSLPLSEVSVRSNFGASVINLFLNFFKK